MLMACTVLSRPWARRVPRRDAGRIASGARRCPKVLIRRPSGSLPEPRLPRRGDLTMPPASPAPPLLTLAALAAMQTISISQKDS